VASNLASAAGRQPESLQRGELKALIGTGNVSKDLDRQMRDYQAQLEQAKDIAMEVATVWAQKNPKLAQSTGAGSVIQHAKRAGPAELKFQHNYLSPEIDGAFDDGSGAIAHLPAIKFQSAGFQREYPAMPVRIRVGEHQRDKTADRVSQYGLQHHLENKQENPRDRAFVTPELDGGSHAEVERAARDITLGVLESQTAYADSVPTKIYLHSTELNRATVLEVKTDSEGQKFWSVVTSMPSTREQMLKRFKAPTSVVGTTLNGQGTQQALDIKRGILDKLKEPGKSPVTSESYIIDEDGLLFKQSVASQPLKTEPKVLARDANGRIILNKNKTQLSERISETEESNPDPAPGEVQLSWGAKPGASTGLMPRMAVNSGAGAQRVYLMAMKNALSVYGPERMLWDKGRFKELVGGGGWKGITGYAVQSTLQLPDGKLDDRTRAEVDFFLATRGMWLAQEGMAWHAPIFGQNGLGLEINLGGTQLSHTEFEELYAAVRHELNDYSVPPIPSKDGIRFLNFTGIAQAEFINKLKKAIHDTSIFDIFAQANDNSTEGSQTGDMAGATGATLRPGSSDLQRGSDHDGNAFTPEGIRTFDFDGDLIENDWRLGEGQYRERAIKAWELLKDLPDQSLPNTLDELNVYLADTQQRVDAVNAKYATEYYWQHANLTSQQRATGIGASFEYPPGKIDSPRAAKAYFRNPASNANPNGTLQTLYSGTISDIRSIKAGMGEHTKAGAVFFASTDPIYAADRAWSTDDAFPGRAKKSGVGQNVIPVYILAENPFDWRILSHRDSVLEKMPQASDGLVEAIEGGEYSHIESKPVQKAIKEAGFDSFLVRDDADDVGYMGIGIFNPEDVVFAIDLDGQKLATPETQLSARVEEAPSGKRDFVGRTGRTYTPEQLKAFSNVGFEVELPTLKERAQALWKDAGKKMAQGIVDQFMPIKELSKEAYGLLRLSKGWAGSFETLLKGGKLKLTDGVYDFDETQKGGVIDKLLIPMQGEHHDFLRWVAANRAESLLTEPVRRRLGVGVRKL